MICERMFFLAPEFILANGYAIRTRARVGRLHLIPAALADSARDVLVNQDRGQGIERGVFPL